MLIGRVTYDSFAGAWPDREAAGGDDAGFAKKLGDARKIVVSHQPLEFTWRNSEQLQGDLVEFVTKLKKEPGGDIGMSGSPSIVRQLLEAEAGRRAAPARAPGRGRATACACSTTGDVDPAEAAQVQDLRRPACSTWSTAPTSTRPPAGTRRPWRPSRRTEVAVLRARAGDPA